MFSSFAEDEPVNDPYHPPKVAKPTISMGEVTGEVYHFAYWNLRPIEKTENMETLERSVTRMEAIPGVTGVYFGKGLSVPAFKTCEIDCAMVETFSSPHTARAYLPNPLHHATIDISHNITEKGGAIYFMPLTAFTSASDTVVPACMQVAWLWLPESDNHLASEGLIQAAQALRNIPGLIDVKFGPRMRTNWIGPDDSIDCAIVLPFDSVESATKAVSHTAHLNLRNTMERVGRQYQWYAFSCDVK